MKRIALPAGLLLVVMLAVFAMLRARAQDDRAKPILPLDPPEPVQIPRTLSITEQRHRRSQQVASDAGAMNAVTLKIVSLRTLQAKDAVRTLDEVFNDRQAVIAADERSNSVILRGPEAELEELIALLEQLDSAESPELRKTLTRRLRSDDEVMLEKRVLELKTKFDDEGKGSTGQKTKDADTRLQELAEQIRNAVDESFNERQRQQLAEIEELTVRLNKLAKTVREREEKREAIIEERISELIGVRAKDEEWSTISEFSRDTGMDELRPSAIPEPATKSMAAIDVDGQSQGLNLVDLAEKIHSLRKSIASQLEGIESLKKRLSTYEATPNLAGLDGHNNILAKATVALQQKRDEVSTYKQLLSIEDAAAKAQHNRTTEEMHRVGLLNEKGAVSMRQVRDAEVAVAKSRAAVDRLKVLVELFRHVEEAATPAATEQVAPGTNVNDLVPDVKPGAQLDANQARTDKDEQSKPIEGVKVRVEN